MATDRNKVVQNYCLEDLNYYNPDQSEIWTAKHKILKKNFTLKRIKYRSNQPEQIKGLQTSVKKQEWDYSNLVHETNMLKRLMSQMCPKCHKMIKTSNNIYVVYDQFPQINLKQFIAKNSPHRSQKLSLMLQIAKALNYFHTRSIIFLYLSTGNIFIKDKITIFFSDWTLARTVQTQDRIDPAFLGGGYQSLSPQLIKGEKYSYWSDIYCLGTVFQRILRSGLLEEPSQTDKKIEQLIVKMHLQKGHQRPRLEQIIRSLQNLGGQRETDKKSPQNTQKKMNSLKSVGGFKIKHSISTPQADQSTKNIKILTPEKKYTYLQTPKIPKDQSLSTSFSKSAKTTKSQTNNEQLHTISSTRKLDSKRSFEFNNNNSINYSRKKKEQQKLTLQQFIKIINKKRNLAFFMIELSEFVIKMCICPELGYVLLKYSHLTIKSTIKELQKQQGISLIQKSQILQILNDEKMKIVWGLNFLRKNVFNSPTDNFLQRQFEIENQISDKYLKQKIVEFVKQMVVYCENNSSQKSSSQKLIDNLFKTYMILKKIEQGGYQKFWDKVYNSQYAFLHNQKYLKEQKQLGHRYLKSRIAEILRAK